jgi:CheY-like chemotaxis protein
MKNNYVNYFDLLSLLRLNSYDVRLAARNNLLLTTGAYFRLLTDFIQNMPQIKEILDRVSAQEGLDDDVQKLEDYNVLLKDIGCDKIASSVTEIIRTCKRGHYEFASDVAKKLIVEFDSVYTGINTAKTETQPDPAYEDYLTQPLHNVLKSVSQNDTSHRMVILAVDDDPIIIETITSLLEKEYKVFGITNPTMLEKFLQQITPDLILLDYKMPELSGFDLMPIIRGVAALKETPVIFLTSMGTVSHVSAAAALGACDFIVKPFQDDMLREKIAKHIGK